MKRILFTLISLTFFIAAFSQTGFLYKKAKSVGLNFTFHDFTTASEIRSKGLSDVLNKKEFSIPERLKAGLAVSYTEGLSDHFDVNARVGFSLLESTLQDKSNGANLGKQAYFESDASIFMKLTSDKYFISPFLSAGAGASVWQGYYAAYVPVGVGIQLNLFDESFITFQSQYRLPVTANNNFHLFYSLGILGNIGGKSKVTPIAPPPSAPVVVDTDNDGVPDATDKCPLVAGLAKYNGCPIPDSDKDGINDEQDKCPTVAGIAKYGGCPIPDSDKDGINDEQDKCPTVAGIAKYGGCPAPDKDGDGVVDEDDRCIDIPGVASNKGCPIIELRGENLVFQTGKSILLSKGSLELNEAANILSLNPQINVLVEGYTDNTGTDKINDPLSLARATAVKNYLVKKGIAAARFETIGYGSKMPIAENATAEGRAKNRRVNIKVK